LTEDQEAAVGDAGIAAPILNREGVVADAIGIVGPAERLLAPQARDDLARAGVDAARSISRDLGARRGGGALAALS
jgi:DNA-binding IclR family transcriptional regulator